MKLDKNLASIHAYLCADGYVIKNPENQTHKKYYRIGFRNTNLSLLKDFQYNFEKVFKVKPRLIEGERCELGSKEIYEKLTKEFGSFYSAEWKIPKLNKKLNKIWLRSFFDCEAWVFCKSHQNRHIGLDSINEEGINEIIRILNDIGIKTIKKINKKRQMFRIFIYGKDNLEKFKDKIGFLHPDKKEKLEKAINDYMDYLWKFPEENLKNFTIKILKEKARIKKPSYIRIISKEESNLLRLKENLINLFEINSLVYKRTNGLGTIYYEININRKEDINKLISLRIIPNIFKQK